MACHPDGLSIGMTQFTPPGVDRLLVDEIADAGRWRATSFRGSGEFDYTVSFVSLLDIYDRCGQACFADLKTHERDGGLAMGEYAQLEPEQREAHHHIEVVSHRNSVVVLQLQALKQAEEAMSQASAAGEGYRLGELLRFYADVERELQRLTSHIQQRQD